MTTIARITTQQGTTTFDDLGEFYEVLDFCKGSEPSFKAEILTDKGWQCHLRSEDWEPTRPPRHRNLGERPVISTPKDPFLEHLVNVGDTLVFSPAPATD